MWFSLFKFLLTIFVNTAIGVLLRPKPERQEASIAVEDLEFPTAERGRKIPVVVGRRHVTSPNVIWYKPGNVFQSGQQGSYTHYTAAMHMVIAYSPLVLFDITSDKKSMNLTSLESIRPSSQVTASVTGYNSTTYSVVYDQSITNTFSIYGVGEFTGNATYFSVGGGVSYSGSDQNIDVVDPELTLNVQTNAETTTPITISGSPHNRPQDYGDGTTYSPIYYTLFVYKDSDTGDFVGGIAAEQFTYTFVEGSEGAFNAYTRLPDIVQTVTISDDFYDSTELQNVIDGVIYGNSTVDINLPDLYGGEKKAGGVVGRVDYLNGIDPPLSSTISYLESQQGGLSPHYLGVSSLVIRGSNGSDFATLGANSPVVKPWSFDVGGYYNSLGVDLEYTVINQGANAACFLYECLVNSEWGKGLTTDEIDASSFRAVAKTLYEEKLGCSFVWTDTEKIDTIMSKVLDDVFGYWVIDVLNEGKIRIGLLRAYEGLLADLPVIRPLKLNKNKGRAANQGVNQVILNYKSHGIFDDSEQSLTLTNDAALAISEGKVKAKTISLPTLIDEDSARYIGNLHLMVESYPLATYQVTVDQFDLEVSPGDYVYYQHPTGSTPIHRVINMDTKNRQITITLLEDMFSYSLNSQLATFTSLVSNKVVSNNYPTHPVTLPYQAMSVISGGTSNTIEGTVKGLAMINSYDQTQVKKWDVRSDDQLNSWSSSGYFLSLQDKKRTSVPYFKLTKYLTAHNNEDTWTTLDLPVVYEGYSSADNKANTLVQAYESPLPYLGYITTGEWVIFTEYDVDTGTLKARRGALGTTPRPAPTGATVFVIPFSQSATTLLAIKYSRLNGSVYNPTWADGSVTLTENLTPISEDIVNHSTLHTLNYSLSSVATTALPPAFVSVATDPQNPVTYEKATNNGHVYFAPNETAVALRVGVRIPTSTDSPVYADDSTNFSLPATSGDTPYYNGVKVYYEISINDSFTTHELLLPNTYFSLHTNVDFTVDLSSIGILSGVDKFTMKIYCYGYRGSTLFLTSEPYVLYFFSTLITDTNSNYTWSQLLMPQYEKFDKVIEV